MHDGRPVREVDVELINTLPPPPKPPKPPPKLSKSGRKNMIKQASIMRNTGYPNEAWKYIVEICDEAGYQRSYAHVIAGVVDIPRSERYL